MKKHAFRIGLVVTMLLGLMTISANAANCTGDHSGATEWTAETTMSGNTTLVKGTYVLTENVTFTDTQLRLPAGTVTICLNGNTLTFGKFTSLTSNTAVYANKASSTLNICDCKGGGKIVDGSGTSLPDYFYNTSSNSTTVNLYGGTIKDFGSSANSRGVFYFNNTTSKFNMYGGTITPCDGAPFAIRNLGTTTVSGDSTIGGLIREDGTKSVSGGTFVQDMSEYVAAGYKCTDKGDGTYTVEADTDGEEIHGEGNGYWKVFEGTIESGKSYYLDEDYITDTQIVIPEGADVGFCLHGKTLTSRAAENAIVVSSGATLTLCEGCTEATAGTITADEDTTSRAIQINGGTVKMYGGTITGFTTDGDGGAVLIPSDSGGTFTMSNGTITDNTAANGGGVCCKKGTVTLSGGTISNNTATAAGGGIQAQTVSTTVNLNGVVITGNTAKNGGGVNTASGAAKIKMTAGEISNNTATTGDGGGLRLNYGADGTMSGGFIYGNKSGGKGPGVYLVINGANNDSTFTVTGGSIGLNGNDAPAANVKTDGTQAEGTAVYVTGGAATIKGGKFYCNTANAETPDTVFFGDGVDVQAAQLNDKPNDILLADDCMTYQVSDNGETLIYEVAKKFAPDSISMKLANNKLYFWIYFIKNDMPGGKDDYTFTFSDGETANLYSYSNTKWYVEHAGIAAKDMGDEVTLTIENNGKTVSSTPFSVKQYATAILEDSSSTNELKAAMSDLLRYGAAAQTYFGTGDTLVTAGVTALVDGSTWTPEDLSDVSADDGETKLYLGSALSLKNRIYLNLYFDSSVDSVAVGTTSYTPTEENGRKVVKVPTTLSNAVTKLEITIKAGDTSVNVSDSVQAYAYRATKLTVTDPNLANLCQAMMNFVLSGNAYRATQS